MYIVSSFEHSIHLELALSDLELLGISSDNILAIPLSKNLQKRRIFDTMHYSDGFSLFDLAAALGTACMVLGTIYGYVLKWGPIIWALIGLIGGSLLGFIIDYTIFKKRDKQKRHSSTRTSEVILIIKCNSSKVTSVKKVLWDNLAIGVGELDELKKDPSK